MIYIIRAIYWRGYAVLVFVRIKVDPDRLMDESMKVDACDPGNRYLPKAPQLPSKLRAIL